MIARQGLVLSMECVILFAEEILLMTTFQEAITDENRRIRLLRITSDLLVQLLMSGSVPASEADSLICGVKDLAMRLFPGKEPVFDLIYMPRFRRALLESGAYAEGLVLKIVEGGRNMV
jgi:hypothetical protein